jgi:hypothetical protein
MKKEVRDAHDPAVQFGHERVHGFSLVKEPLPRLFRHALV